MFLIGCIDLILVPVFVTSFDLLFRTVDLSAYRMLSLSVRHRLQRDGFPCADLLAWKWPRDQKISVISYVDRVKS